MKLIVVVFGLLLAQFAFTAETNYRGTKMETVCDFGKGKKLKISVDIIKGTAILDTSFAKTLIHLELHLKKIHSTLLLTLQKLEVAIVAELRHSQPLISPRAT